MPSPTLLRVRSKNNRIVAFFMDTFPVDIKLTTYFLDICSVFLFCFVVVIFIVQDVVWLNWRCIFFYHRYAFSHPYPLNPRSVALKLSTACKWASIANSSFYSKWVYSLARFLDLQGISGGVGEICY